MFFAREVWVVESTQAYMYTVHVADPIVLTPLGEDMDWLSACVANADNTVGYRFHSNTDSMF